MAADSKQNSQYACSTNACTNTSHNVIPNIGTTSSANPSAIGS